MNEIKDWKGNKAKAGDVIVSYRVIPMFCNKMTYIKDGVAITKPWCTKRKYNSWWEYLGEQKVVDLEGELFLLHEFPEGDLYTKPIIGIDSVIMCIKGVSDNKKEYYKFKNENRNKTN